MSNHIKNAFAHAKKAVRRQDRRVRPSYPDIQPGIGKLLKRSECGRNQEMIFGPVKDGHSPRVLFGQFIFLRQINRPTRSKYEPHIGIKQAARLSRVAFGTMPLC